VLLVFTFLCLISLFLFIKSPTFAHLGSGEVTWHQLQKKSRFSVTSINIGPPVACKRKVKVNLEQHHISLEPQANLEQCMKRILTPGFLNRVGLLVCDARAELPARPRPRPFPSTPL
jgi:hypothetical protein